MLSSGNTNYMLSSNISKQIKYTIINGIWCAYLPTIHFLLEHAVFTKFLSFHFADHITIIHWGYLILSPVQNAIPNSYTRIGVWLYILPELKILPTFVLGHMTVFTVYTMWKCMLYFVYPSCVWIKEYQRFDNKCTKCIAHIAWMACHIEDKIIILYRALFKIISAEMALIQQLLSLTISKTFNIYSVNIIKFRFIHLITSLQSPLMFEFI